MKVRSCVMTSSEAGARRDVPLPVIQFVDHLAHTLPAQVSVKHQQGLARRVNGFGEVAGLGNAV
jgi:hypothetical protein